MLRRCVFIVCVVLVAAARASAQQGGAAFQDGRYEQSGMRLQVPQAWAYLGTNDAQPPGASTAHWRDPQTGANLYVWMNPKRANEDLAEQLANAVPNKALQRERQGYDQWRVRPESVGRTVIAGQQTLSAVADFISKGNGEAKVELLTWILGSESRMLMFAFVSPDQLDAFQREFNTVVRSARLP